MKIEGLQLNLIVDQRNATRALLEHYQTVFRLSNVKYINLKRLITLKQRELEILENILELYSKES